MKKRAEWCGAVAGGAALLLCLCGGVLLMNREVSERTALQRLTVRGQIASMIEGAQQVAWRVRPLAKEGCTPERQRQLTTLARRQPQVEGIRLFREGKTVCTTAGGAPEWQPDEAGWRLVASGRPALFLTRHSGRPVLILLQGSGRTAVAVTLSAAAVSRLLRGLPGRPALVFRAGGQELDMTGQIRPVTAPPHFTPQGYWPFSLQPDPVRRFSWQRMLAAGWPWLMFSLLATFAVLHLCRQIFSLRYRDRAQARLASAIGRGEVQPWYQPVVEATSGAMTGCEVLARWVLPDGQVVTPDQFIPLAERSGLIIPLTRRLMARVAADLRPVAGRLPAGFHLALNISTAHARDRRFLRACRRLQAALGEGQVQMVVEITERERFESVPGMLRFLNGLRRAGVHIALDDFGTGYAGIASLDSLPVDYLKLDHSFTRNAGHELAGRPSGADIVTAMAARLGMDVVAEGIETPAQRDWMVAHGVKWLQGYYFSRPMEGEAFCRLVSAGPVVLPEPAQPATLRVVPRITHGAGGGG